MSSPFNPFAAAAAAALAPTDAAKDLIRRRNQFVETHVLMLCRMHNLDPNEKVEVATFQGRPVHKTLAETMKPAARKQMAEQGWPEEDED